MSISFKQKYARERATKINKNQGLVFVFAQINATKLHWWAKQKNY